MSPLQLLIWRQNANSQSRTDSPSHVKENNVRSIGIARGYCTGVLLLWAKASILLASGTKAVIIIAIFLLSHRVLTIPLFTSIQNRFSTC